MWLCSNNPNLDSPNFHMSRNIILLLIFFQIFKNTNSILTHRPYENKQQLLLAFAWCIAAPALSNYSVFPYFPCQPCYSLFRLLKGQFLNNLMKLYFSTFFMIFAFFFCFVHEILLFPIIVKLFSYSLFLS